MSLSYNVKMMSFFSFDANIPIIFRFLLVHLTSLKDLIVETPTQPLINYLHYDHIVIYIQFHRNIKNIKQCKVCIYTYIISVYDL